MTLNGTYHVDCLVDEQQQQREIVYIALTLLVTSLSALIASFLGLRRRRSAIVSSRTI